MKKTRGVVDKPMTDITILQITAKTIEYRLSHKRDFADKYGNTHLTHELRDYPGWEGYKDFLLGAISVDRRYRIEQSRDGRNLYWVGIIPIRNGNPDYTKAKCYGDVEEQQPTKDVSNFIDMGE